MSATSRQFHSELDKRDDLIQELVASLKDILSRFESCIGGGNGEIEGDKEAIAVAKEALAKTDGE
jgi:hypothetical protein